MGTEEIKLRATFWNNLAVGLALTGILIPSIWVYQNNPRVTFERVLSFETVQFIFALAISTAMACVCRIHAIAIIRKLD